MLDVVFGVHEMSRIVSEKVLAHGIPCVFESLLHGDVRIEV